MDEPVDEPEFTPDERECDLLARLAHRRLELQRRVEALEQKIKS